MSEQLQKVANKAQEVYLNIVNRFWKNKKLYKTQKIKNIYKSVERHRKKVKN